MFWLRRNPAWVRASLTSAPSLNGRLANTFRFFADGGFAPLIDNNSDGIVDTGPIRPGQSVKIVLAVTLGGTLLSGGRFSLAGSIVGALIIQTLTSTIYSIGVPPEINE